MAKVVVAPALARWLPTTPTGAALELQVPATDLREALRMLFEQHPALRGYVQDEQGAVRHHVAVIVDGEALTDKRTLVRPLRADSEVYLMQALSGG